VRWLLRCFAASQHRLPEIRRSTSRRQEQQSSGQEARSKECRSALSTHSNSNLRGKREKRKWPHSFLNVAIINAGNDLLSHTLSRAVQSALRGLTSVFGMGTGGSPAVRSPTTRSCQLSAVSFQQLCAVLTFEGLMPSKLVVPATAASR
jgi:hypothetical protein